MTRHKKTRDYLEQLKSKDYARYDELLGLYKEWKQNQDSEALSRFLQFTWDEIDNIRPILGLNAFNNFRGFAFEEFCFDLLERIVSETEAGNVVQLFWNKRILTEEFYVFNAGQFQRHPKYKAVDLVLGQSETKPEGELIHPLVIVSCKTWQMTNWLDEDRAIFDSIRNRYPNVIGYSLCMSLKVPPVSLISSQRTGLQVFDLSEGVDAFCEDIKGILQGVRDDRQITG